LHTYALGLFVCYFSRAPGNNLLNSFTLQLSREVGGGGTTSNHKSNIMIDKQQQAFVFVSIIFIWKIVPIKKSLVSLPWWMIGR